MQDIHQPYDASGQILSKKEKAQPGGLSFE